MEENMTKTLPGNDDESVCTVDEEDDIYESSSYKKTDSIGARTYKEVCRRMKIFPSEKIAECFGKTELKIRYRYMNPVEIRALITALILDTTIIKLNLSNIGLVKKSLDDLNILLKENTGITSINVSDNKIATAGAEIFSDILRTRDILRTLKLNGCSLKDDDIKILTGALRENKTLLSLHINHNEIGESGAKALSRELSINKSLEQLDLSWNHIRLTGAKAISNAMLSNNTLRCLKLSYNGFADEGAESLSKVLKVNASITYLDIASNRITDIGANDLQNGLSENTSLEVFDISNNPITLTGVQSIIAGVHKGGSVVELYLRNLPVDRSCLSQITEIRKKTMEFKVIHGIILQTRELSEGDDADDLLLKIFDLIRQYISQKRYRMLDLFNSWDKDKSGYLTHDEFIHGFQTSEIPLTQDMLDYLINVLDKNLDNKIAYCEFVAVSHVE